MAANPKRSLRRFTILTMGCKVNQYESESIAQALCNRGLMDVTPLLGKQEAQPDLCIVNTCCVTGKAAMQSRQTIRRMIRRHPQALILVTGCYAQTAPADISAIPGVHGVIGHAEKHRLPEIVLNGANDKELFRPGPVWKKPGPHPPFVEASPPLNTRTRPFLKIQDGCDAFCTYCIVPYARGPVRSMPFETVRTHVACIAQAGFHEVVLTGIHLGRYGSDLTPTTSLASLLKTLINDKAIDRIRLSSIEPLEFTADLLQTALTAAEPPGHVCRHFHVPLQSGADRILQRMKRPYRRREFTDLVQRLHHAMPDAAIGADVLIGFPGETDQDFAETFTLIQSLPLAYLHVFPFSPRGGTAAATLDGRVNPAVIRERCRRIRRLGREKRRLFLNRLVDRRVEILVEQQRDTRTGQLKGMTSNYATILTKGSDALQNTLQTVRITGLVDGRTLAGERL